MNKLLVNKEILILSAIIISMIPFGFSEKADYAEFAYNQKTGNSELRGFGITHDPYDNEVTVEEGDVVWTINPLGPTSNGRYVFESAGPGTIIEPGAEIKDFLAPYGGNLDSILKSSKNYNDDYYDMFEDYPFNRDVDESPERSDCTDKYWCNAAYFEEDAYEGGGKFPEEHDVYHWDLKGEVLITGSDEEEGGNGEEPYFWQCIEGWDGDSVTVQGELYFCDGSEAEWEVSECQDPAIGRETAAGHDNIFLYQDRGGDQYSQEFDGEDCFYRDIGHLNGFEQHPVNRDDITEHQEFEEPYVFRCSYGDGVDYFDVEEDDVTLEGFEADKWGDYTPLGENHIGPVYDQVREYEAMQYCMELPQAFNENPNLPNTAVFTDLYDDSVPVAEYYHTSATMPLTDYWLDGELDGDLFSTSNDVGLTRYFGEHPEDELEFQGEDIDISYVLKHFRFQSIHEAHLERESSWYPYLEGYRLRHDSGAECSNEDAYSDFYCTDYLNPLDWTYDENSYLESDSMQPEDLYEGENSPWTVSNVNGYMSDNVQSNPELSHPDLDQDIDLSDVEEHDVMDDNVFHGGFAPNCSDGETFQYTSSHNLANEEDLTINAGEEVWKCAEEPVTYQPEIYLPEVEELGTETDEDINIGLFFPPSTFEYYENDEIPSSRRHLDPDFGTRNMQTAAQAVERAQPVEETPRVRGLDVVCGLGDEDRVTPEGFESIPNNQKFQKENIQVPRPPVNQIRGEDVDIDGFNAPLPVTGEINGGAVFLEDYDTITCIWRYRYAGDAEEEWFSSGEARNLACDNPQNCDTGITNVNDEAENRDWRTQDLPNQEVDSEITSDEVEEYQEAWQLTNDENQWAVGQNEDDGVGSELSFSLDAVENMIDSVLQVIG